MKKLLLLTLAGLIALFLCGCEPDYAVDTFYATEMLNDYGLAGLPVPKLENSRLNGEYLYCNLTQEEYEAKVQSMPHELQNQFRQSLEINLSKRIVNRFMSTVMQAYAWGQRAEQKVSRGSAYIRGAEDMLEALRTISSMEYEDVKKYFPGDYNNDVSGLRKILLMNPGDILVTAHKYMDDEMQGKEEREKAEVQAMSDKIGIDKLCEIADKIRKQKVADGECLPF
jgi:hypothetical protein